MISSVSFDSSLSMTSSSSSGSSRQSLLSLDQQEFIDSTLSQYDSSSLTQEDAQEIVAAFSQAGIQPSRELADAMDSLGFDAKEIGDLAGVGPSGQGGMPPPPPPPMNQEDQDTVSSILETLFEADEEDETASSYESIQDYTSRILSLNDEAKASVMSLFEEYAPENTTLNREEASTVMRSVLTELLKNSDNYESTSFYA